jgi:hypothetical protein
MRGEVSYPVLIRLDPLRCWDWTLFPPTFRTADNAGALNRYAKPSYHDLEATLLPTIC